MPTANTKTKYKLPVTIDGKLKPRINVTKELITIFILRR